MILLKKFHYICKIIGILPSPFIGQGTEATVR